MHKLPGRHRQQSGRTQVILGDRARWTDLCCHGKRSHSQRRVYGVYSGHNRIVRRRLTHTYTYSYGYADSDTYADADAYSDPYTDSNAYGDTYADANADSYGHGYSNSYSDGHGHGNSHSHSHGDSHSHSHGDSDPPSCVANPNYSAQNYADAQAAADESSTGRALSGTLKAGTRERHLAEFPRLR